MNLKRILWAFLYTFLILDAVLIYQWVNVNQPLSDPGSTQSAKKEMQMDGINYGQLKNQPISGAYVAGDQDSQLKDKRKQLSSDWRTTESENSIVATPKQQMHLGNNQKEAVENLEKMIKDSSQVIDGREYRYDDFLTNFGQEAVTKNADGYTIIFSQIAESANNQRVFTSQRGRIQFNLDEGFNLKNYTQNHISNVESLRSISALITEEDALINAYQYNEIPNNSIVQASRLSYSTLTVVRGDVIFIPIWSFVVKDSANDVTIVRINALNGTLAR